MTVLELNLGKLKSVGFSAPVMPVVIILQAWQQFYKPGLLGGIGSVHPDSVPSEFVLPTLNNDIIIKGIKVW